MHAKILVGKPEGKRLLVRTRRRWGYNINMNLEGIWCKGVDWTIAGSCGQGNEPYGSKRRGWEGVN
jgi:hypothetical protein